MSALAELNRAARLGLTACTARTACPAQPQPQSTLSQVSSDISPHADVLCLESRPTPPRVADAAAPVRDPEVPLVSAALLRRHRPSRVHVDAARRRLRLPHDFRHCAGISYADLRDERRRRSGSGAGGGVLPLLEDFRWRVASELGGCHPQEVLWFMQLDKEVAPGLRLSFSSAVCSPECVASMAVHHITLKLEAALLTALLEQEAGAILHAGRFRQSLGRVRV